MNAAAFCLGVMGVVSLIIGQPLSGRAPDRIAGPLTVGDAERRAAVVAEIEFRQITVKVSLAAMLVNAEHAALEHGKHVLNRVGVNNHIALAAGVFLGSVLDGSVLGIFAAGRDIEAAFVGIEDRLAVGVADQNIADAINGRVVDVERTNLAAALHKADDDSFCAPPDLPDLVGVGMRPRASLRGVSRLPM